MWGFSVVQDAVDEAIEQLKNLKIDMEKKQKVSDHIRAVLLGRVAGCQAGGVAGCQAVLTRSPGH